MSPIRLSRVRGLLILATAVLLAASVGGASISPTPAVGAAASGQHSCSTNGSHIDYIKCQLAHHVPGGRGRIWEHTTDNTLTGHWLLDTPDCWAGDYNSCVANGSPTPGNRALSDAIRTDIAAATTWVDIATLMNCSGTDGSGSGSGNDQCTVDGFPDGSFHQAIVDGLNEAVKGDAININNKLVVRILGGSPQAVLSNGIPQEKYVSRLQQALSTEAKFDVDLTVMRHTTDAGAWNHAKIVAVDGRTAITGGQNLWAEAYESASPVADLSVRVVGPAAGSAHDFLDELWTDKACPDSRTAKNWPATPCPREHRERSGGQRGTVDVLSVASMGTGIVDNTLTDPGAAYPSPLTRCRGMYRYDETMVRMNPELIALWSLIESADRRIDISAQQLSAALGPCNEIDNPIVGPSHPIDNRLFDLLAQKMRAGVKVRIIVTGAGTGSAGYGGSTDPRLPEITSSLRSRVNDTTLCENLELAPLRHKANVATWPNGTPPRNHTKLISVDNEAFYVGSRNLYPANLQEHGFIIEDSGASATLTREYLDPAWQASRPDAVVDHSQGRCRLDDGRVELQGPARPIESHRRRATLVNNASLPAVVSALVAGDRHGPRVLPSGDPSACDLSTVSVAAEFPPPPTNAVNPSLVLGPGDSCTFDVVAPTHWPAGPIDVRINTSIGHSVVPVEVVDRQEYQVTAQGSWVAVGQRLTGISAGDRVVISAWVKTSGLSGSTFVSLNHWQHGVKRNVVQRSNQVSGTRGWTQVATTFVVPPGTTMIEPMFVVNGRGTARIDSFHVYNSTTERQLAGNGGFEGVRSAAPPPYWFWSNNNNYSLATVVSG